MIVVTGKPVFVHETEKGICRIYEGGKIFKGGKLTDYGKVAIEEGMIKFAKDIIKQGQGGVLFGCKN